MAEICIKIPFKKHSHTGKTKKPSKDGFFICLIDLYPIDLYLIDFYLIDLQLTDLYLIDLYLIDLQLIDLYLIY